MDLLSALERPLVPGASSTWTVEVSHGLPRLIEGCGCLWLCGHFPAAKAWKPRCLVIPTLTRSQSPKHSPLHTTRTRSLGPIPKTNPRYLECLSKARADPDDSDVGVLPCLTVPPLGTRWQDAYSSRDQTHHQRESTDPSCMELV